MLRPRIIPCLLIHKGGLVKTRRFSEQKYVGDPINAVKIFNEKESDELIVLDIDATITNAEPNFGLIAKLAEECRMPLCYGGGIKTVDHASRIVDLGVEKIAISSAAVENPSLLGKISKAVGRQSVVVVLDVRRRTGLLSKGYEVFTHNGTRANSMDLIQAAISLEMAGAGEIVINSIDRDGEMTGYDLDLALAIKRTVHVPMTMLGGAGSLDDIQKLIGTCGVVGAAAGSLFVFKGRYRAVLINYPTPLQKDVIYRNMPSD